MCSNSSFFLSWVESAHCMNGATCFETFVTDLQVANVIKNLHKVN